MYITNTQDYETYVDDVSDYIFPYGILLKGCKWLKSQEDTNKLYNIKHDIFVKKNISVDDLIETYFRCTDDITSLGFNIAFFSTCKNVSGRRTTEYVNMNVERDLYAVNILKYMVCLM